MTQVKPVLFVLSSAAQLLNGDAAGWYLPEAAHPALVLDAAGIPIEFASPGGGAAPLNPASVDMFKDEESVKFLLEWEDKYENTKKLGECQAEDYSAVFVVGGHGPMIDLSADMGFARLVEDFYNAKKPVSAICHGPAALVNAKTPTGDSILKGKQVNGLSNAEEAKFINFAELEKYLPFSLEDRLNELSEGGYVKADVMQCKVVYDGGILTGQNPASGKAMGEKLVELLRA